MTRSAPAALPVRARHLAGRAAHPDFTEARAALLFELALAGKRIARELARAALTGKVGEALRRSRLYGAEAGNLALKALAVGGVFAHRARAL